MSLFGFDDDDEVVEVPTTFCSILDVKGNKSCREGGEVESSALSSTRMSKKIASKPVNQYERSAWLCYVTGRVK